ncbi:M55 family metallopeptidase [Ferrimicrobium sp.]|uniref:M55 family metallopeptidase n=1 Tax=Ferrimicrobium sp. TaxID=2926050 RepID=UPI0026231CA7|nr:M55 family metallopeptidase [Ferrimicrobium sp.]
MKVYISFDMEGISGIVDWDQCTGNGPAVAMGQELTLAEINAAIDGALMAGATEFVVNDAHYRMQNLDPRLLHGDATYISGAHKPGYMMEGLTSDFDVIFFIGYHGSISGVPSVMSHSYSPSVFTELRVNDVEVGESGVNALVALGQRVPIGLISGDRATALQAEPLMKQAIMVQVKESITRYAASNLHPHLAHKRLSEAAERAVEAAKSIDLPAIDLPATITMSFQTSDQAELASWIAGVERADLRSCTITGPDPLALYRAFVGVCYLTRQAQGR